MNGSFFNDMAPNARRAFIVTIALSAEIGRAHV